MKSEKQSLIKTIGVLTSGGDSPGMNACIRSIVRTAKFHNLNVYGIQKGYAGLLEGSMTKMDVASVGNILQRGGTILGTSRCPEFMEKDGRKEAANILKRKNIDGLIVIGGNGSFVGAKLLYEENNIPVVAIPGTIDNDISGTDYTIGFDTAVQTAVEAVDKIRDTASSHARIFLVEVMGRNSASIALNVGIGTGAENIVFPQKGINLDEIVSSIQRGVNRGKTSSIIIVAEGDVSGISYEIQKDIQEKFLLKSHVCILGHIQRGGTPSSTDRFIASQMGAVGVMALIEGKYPMVTTINQGNINLTPFDECLDKKSGFDEKIVNLAKMLSI